MDTSFTLHHSSSPTSYICEKWAENTPVGVYLSRSLQCLLRRERKMNPLSSIPWFECTPSSSPPLNHTINSKSSSNYSAFFHPIRFPSNNIGSIPSWTTESKQVVISRFVNSAQNLKAFWKSNCLLSGIGEEIWSSTSSLQTWPITVTAISISQFQNKKEPVYPPSYSRWQLFCENGKSPIKQSKKWVFYFQ